MQRLPSTLRLTRRNRGGSARCRLNLNKPTRARPSLCGGRELIIPGGRYVAVIGESIWPIYRDWLPDSEELRKHLFLGSRDELDQRQVRLALIAKGDEFFACLQR